LAQLEEIRLPEGFHLGHGPFVAEGDIASHQGRLLFRRQPRQQPGQAVLHGMGLAVLDFDVRNQAHVADTVNMQDRLKTSGLLWGQRYSWFGTKALSARRRPSSLRVLLMPRISGAMASPRRLVTCA